MKNNRRAITGELTHEQMASMPNIVSTIEDMDDGTIVRRIGSKIMYYQQHEDKSWSKYKEGSVG